MHLGPGDAIVQVADHPVENWSELLRKLLSLPGEPAAVVAGLTAEELPLRKGLPGFVQVDGQRVVRVRYTRPGEGGKRAYEAMEKALHELDLVVRAAGETLVLTPPLIVSEREIDVMFAKVARVIKAVA